MATAWVYPGAGWLSGWMREGVMYRLGSVGDWFLQEILGGLDAGQLLELLDQLDAEMIPGSQQVHFYVAT